MRGKILYRTALHCITLANSLVGKLGIHYHLQYPNGGTDPEADGPQDKATGYCDCIGFACWCAGFDRFQPGKFPLYDGYINTDSMIEEAEGQGKWFTVLDQPEDGCFIVGHTYRTLLGKKIVGHIGVVTDASEWKTKGLAGLKVVHCSAHNSLRPGNKNLSAVWKTDGLVWANYKRMKFIKFNYEYASKVVAK